MCVCVVFEALRHSDPCEDLQESLQQVRQLNLKKTLESFQDDREDKSAGSAAARPGLSLSPQLGDSR